MNLVSNAVGVTVVSASTAVNVAGIVLNRTTNGSGGNSGNASKNWVDANIQISPLTDSNALGDTHVLTGHVNVNPGTGFVNAPEGTTINFAIVSGPGTLGPPASCQTIGTTGSCTVNLVSNTPGVTVVSASTTVTVGGVVINRTTNGTGGNSGNASKNWVDANIQISPLTDSNALGDTHVLTGHVNVNPGTGFVNAPEGTLITFAIVSGPGTLGPPTTCTTVGTTGSCTVNLTSNATGVTVVSASTSVTVGGVVLNRTTNGTGGNSGNASKNWVDANIQISPLTDSNALGDTHVLTGHVNVNPGTGFVNAPDGTTITFAIVSGPGTLGPPASCVTAGGTGSCSVNLVSNTPGVTVVSASTTVTVGGVVINRTTNGTGGNSGNASKNWVDANIQISPLTDSNALGDTHILTGHVNVNPGTGFVNAPAGTTITFAIVSGPGTIGPPTSCQTIGTTGSCTVNLVSNATGVTTVSASTSVTVGGVVLNRTTNGTGGNSGNATKNWVDANIQISPLTDSNAVGDTHVLTGHVNVNPGTGFVNAPEGTTITFAIVSGPGTMGPPTSCTTIGTTGSCTVNLVSNTPGVTLVSASTSVNVGGVVINRTTNGTGGNSGNASKNWVDARISLSPLTATNPIGTNHTVLVDVDINPGTGFVAATEGDVSYTLTNSGGATAVENTALSTCDDGQPTLPDNLNASGQCTIVFNSPTAGTTTVNASVTVVVGGVTITRTTGTAANTAAGGTGDASKTWQAGGALFLIIDEDSIDNGIQFHASPTIGQQNIFPNTPTQFSDLDVNDDKAAIGQRDVLRYWAQNPGRVIALRTGQTGDEGWFAPNCIPLKWVSGNSSTCADPFTQALANFMAGTVPQSKLDKIPDVRPLRARGIEMLEGRTVCAVVYDSDISINYQRNGTIRQVGNLQGATLGIVAFTVLDNGVNKMNQFSSSTLPEAQIRIESAAQFCGGPFELFGAPIPKSSSVPNDIDPHSLLDDVGYIAPVPPAPPIP